MRRFDKKKHIQKVNESINKKNTLNEDFGGYNEEPEQKTYYDHILQGHEATEENAYAHAKGMDWGSLETTAQHLPNLDFIDNVDGVEIYYDHGADYYCFAPQEMDESTHEDSFDQFTPNRDKSIDGPRSEETPYDRENRSLKPNSRFGENEEVDIRETKAEDFDLLNEGTLSVFDKLCGVKIKNK